MGLTNNMTLLTSNSTAPLLKKLLLIIGTLLPINSALPGWQFIGETSFSRYFTDMTTIKPSGDKRTVMMYQNLRFKRTSDGAVSIEAKLEYDCRYKMHRMLTATAYPGPNLLGDKLKSKAPGNNWNPTYKMSRFMLTAVCSVPNSGKLEIKTY